MIRSEKTEGTEPYIQFAVNSSIQHCNSNKFVLKINKNYPKEK